MSGAQQPRRTVTIDVTYTLGVDIVGPNEAAIFVTIGRHRQADVIRVTWNGR